MAPVPPPPGAVLVARRFLLLYTRAYAGPLGAGARAALRRAADPAIVSVLLEQPPAERLAAGRVGALRMSELDAGAWVARAALSFDGLRTSAVVVVSRDVAGAWRVTLFEPGARSL